jgi:signal transduction histidine kinase
MLATSGGLRGAPLVGDWDCEQIEQVLANLIGNALKYSPVDRPVRLTGARCGDEVALSVTDEGIGLVPDELTTLFGRLHRTDGARASGLPGTGLGLYLARGIVEAHGGRIEAASAGHGHGALFRVTLLIAGPSATGGDEGT